MTGKLALHLLPAADGDCLFVEAIGDDGATTTMLVDGGREHTYANWCPVLRDLLGERRTIDLVIVTHMDADHIGGVLAMLQDEDRGFRINQIWFNGRRQVEASRAPLEDLETFGTAQADTLSKAILAQGIPWNGFVDGGPVVGESPNFDLGPLRLTMLTPTRAKLGSLAGIWDTVVADIASPREMEEAGFESFGVAALDFDALVQEPDQNDTAKPNGSSIGVLVEAFGKSLLLAGDCHPNDLTKALSGLRLAGTLPERIDVFKLSHHGASKNTTRELLQSVVAEVYAISTNGRHDHPAKSTVAKVIASCPELKTLAFNYRVGSTEIWDDELLKTNRCYSTQYPLKGQNGYLRIFVG